MHSRSVDNPSQIYAKLGKSCRTSAVAVSHLAPVLESSLAYFECPCSPFATAHGSVSLLGLALRASLGHFLRAIRSRNQCRPEPTRTLRPITDLIRHDDADAMRGASVYAEALSCRVR